MASALKAVAALAVALAVVGAALLTTRLVAEPRYPAIRTGVEGAGALRAYETAVAETRERRFFVASAYGVVALAVGMLIATRREFLGLGPMTGGLATLIYGLWQAEPDLGAIDPGLAVMLLLPGLGALAWVGSRDGPFNGARSND
jgi:hypothetical protein